MTTAAVSFTCALCGPVTVEVPLGRPELVRLGCRDADAWLSVGVVGESQHDLDHLILTGGAR